VLGNWSGSEPAVSGLTEISGGRDRKSLRDASMAAIDSVARTTLAQGLASGGALLEAVSGDRAMVLVSSRRAIEGSEDGVAEIGRLPQGTPVHVCAVGPTSDQRLLSEIAERSGGRYTFAPDAMHLLEAQAHLRALLAGDAVVASGVA